MKLVKSFHKIIYLYSMNSIDSFITSFSEENNISMLWEILVEESFIKINDMEQIRPYFNSLVQDFSNYNEDDIISLNKYFLETFISSIMNKNTQEHSNQKKQRMGDFDTRLAQAQQEFNRFNTKQQPPTIDFSLDKPEEKNTDIDINKLVSERNYDKPIQNNNENNTTKLSEL